MKRILQLTTLALGLAAASTAFAHGDVPLAEHFTGFRGSDAGKWVLKANFGIITSDQTCHYVCEESFSGGDRFSVAAFSMREWVIFTEDKVARTEDGCNFEKVRSLPGAVSDWDIHRRSGRVAFISSDGADRGIWLSKDRGKSFSKLKIDKPDLQMTQLEFIDEDRLVVSAYVSGSGAGAEMGAARFFVTDKPDEVRKADSYKYPYLFAAKGDRILWLGQSSSGKKMVWGTLDSPVGSATSTKAWPSAAVISENGKEVWVSGVRKKGRGLMHGTVDGGDISWEKVQDGHSAQCIGYAGGEVYVCGKESREGVDLQRMKMPGDLRERVTFTDLTGPRMDCPKGSDVATTCPAVWGDLAKALDIEGVDNAEMCPQGDGGSMSGDAGSASDAGNAGGRGSKSFCRTASGGRPLPIAVLFVLVAVAVRRHDVSSPKT